ncbi:MAG: MurR/RpiR family transcriptional regulator, partial [Pseudoflavonifractor sp.]
FILDCGNEVTHMNTRELAGRCDASPAAVVRFAQKLGFKGFNDLKLDLARESAHPPLADFQAVIQDSDSMDTIARKAERIYTQSVDETYRMLNLPLLTAAVEALSHSRSIHLFGMGASGLIAMDFQHKVSRIGIPAFYYSDAHTNLATAALLSPEDIAVAISYSGETRETVLAAQAAKRGGCRVISITKPGRSRLVKYSDFPLFVPGEEQDLRVGAMTSRISGLLILDLLYLGVAKHDFPRTEDCLQKTRSIIRAFQSKRQTEIPF